MKFAIFLAEVTNSRSMSVLIIAEQFSNPWDWLLERSRWFCTGHVSTAGTADEAEWQCETGLGLLVSRWSGDDFQLSTGNLLRWRRYIEDAGLRGWRLAVRYPSMYRSHLLRFANIRYSSDTDTENGVCDVVSLFLLYSGQFICNSSLQSSPKFFFSLTANQMILFNTF